MNNHNNIRTSDAWARLRFSIIGHLLAAPPKDGDAHLAICSSRHGSSPIKSARLPPNLRARSKVRRAATRFDAWPVYRTVWPIGCNVCRKDYSSRARRAEHREAAARRARGPTTLRSYNKRRPTPRKMCKTSASPSACNSRPTRCAKLPTVSRHRVSQRPGSRRLVNPLPVSRHLRPTDRPRMDRRPHVPAHPIRLGRSRNWHAHWTSSPIG